MTENEGPESKPARIRINIKVIDRLSLTDGLSLAGYPEDPRVTANTPAEEGGIPRGPSVGQTEPPGRSIRRRGGPRTPAGKERSKYNAFKHGFFAEESVIDTPFYQDSKEYRRLLREYIRDKEPVGITQMHQVEILAEQHLNSERLSRVWEAFIAERHTPMPRNDLGGLNKQLQDLILKNVTSPAQGSSVIEETVRQKTEDAAMKAKRIRIDAMRKSLPSFDDLESLQRFEAHIMRQYNRALYELERLQNLARGVPVPPRLTISRE